MIDNKIREKLAKMLTLASDGSASKGEIENALAMATQMMIKYNLTRDDIDLSKADPVKEIKYSTNNAWTLSGVIYNWESYLAHFVCNFMGTVKCYLNHGRYNKRPNGFQEFDGDGSPVATRMFTFYGAEEDCEIAVSLYHEIQKAIQMAAIVRYGKWAKGDGGVYCEGFVQGLVDANVREIQKLKDSDSQTSALILVSEKTQLAIRQGAENWLKVTKGIRLTKGQGSTGASGSLSAREEGRSDGSKYGVEKRGATCKIG